jgi:hypothetical protein
MSAWLCDGCGVRNIDSDEDCRRCSGKRPAETIGKAIRPQRGRQAIERKIKALRKEADDLEALLRAFPVDAAEEPNRALQRLAGESPER